MKLCGAGLHDLDDPVVAYINPSDGRRRCGPCRREQARKFARERYANDPEYCARQQQHGRKSAREQYAANPEKYRARARRWHADNPEQHKAHQRKQNARRLRRDSAPDLTAAQWQVLLQAARGRCQYCLKVMGPEEITVDHVEPNKNGGSLTLTNIVPACATCNHGAGGKHAKTVEQWLPPRRAAAFRTRHAKLLARARRILGDQAA